MKNTPCSMDPLPSWRFLETMIQNASPSGFEFPLQQVVAERMRPAVDRIETDPHGNVAGVRNPDGRPRVMLAGHVDEIGLLVKYIDEDGFLFVEPIGCPVLAAYYGQRILVHAAAGSVPGAVLHKRPAPDEKPEFTAKTLWIDIGAKDRAQAGAMVSVGDPVTVDAGMTPLGEDLLMGRAFDDRIGAFIIVEVLHAIQHKKLQAAVHGVSTVQEEVGSRGAISCAFGIHPDIGIAIDVVEATDYPESDKKVDGEVTLGGGPVLLRGSNVNPIIGKRLDEAAKKAKIPCQLTAHAGPTSTDASVMQVSRGGVATALVKIPVRYMHTPAEIVSRTDVVNAVRLLAAFIEDLNTGMNLNPVRTF